VAVAKDRAEDVADDDSDDIVVLTKGKIQATLEEAASLGRLTRSAATEILSELLSIAQRQTDSLISELTALPRRGAPSFPVDGYEDLTVAQVLKQLDGLSDLQLRQVREFERKHANRKSLLDALDKALS
jgi:hypothetical protein